MVSILR